MRLVEQKDHCWVGRKDRFQQVKANSYFSEWRMVVIGIFHGSVLGLYYSIDILHCIPTNDISNYETVYQTWERGKQRGWCHLILAGRALKSMHIQRYIAICLHRSQKVAGTIEAVFSKVYYISMNRDTENINNEVLLHYCFKVLVQSQYSFHAAALQQGCWRMQRKFTRMDKEFLST